MKATTKARMQVSELRSRVEELEAEVKKITAPGPIGRLTGWLKGGVDSVTGAVTSRVEAVRARWSGRQ